MASQLKMWSEHSASLRARGRKKRHGGDRVEGGRDRCRQSDALRTPSPAPPIHMMPGLSATSEGFPALFRKDDTEVAPVNRLSPSRVCKLQALQLSIRSNLCGARSLNPLITPPTGGLKSEGADGIRDLAIDLSTRVSAFMGPSVRSYPALRRFGSTRLSGWRLDDNADGIGPLVPLRAPAHQQEVKARRTRALIYHPRLMPTVLDLIESRADSAALGNCT